MRLNTFSVAYSVGLPPAFKGGTFSYSVNIPANRFEDFQNRLLNACALVRQRVAAQPGSLWVETKDYAPGEAEGFYRMKRAPSDRANLLSVLCKSKGWFHPYVEVTVESSLQPNLLISIQQLLRSA